MRKGGPPAEANLSFGRDCHPWKLIPGRHACMAATAVQLARIRSLEGGSLIVDLTACESERVPFASFVILYVIQSGYIRFLDGKFAARSRLAVEAVGKQILCRAR